MNKILLVLIIASGFLLIIYANSSIFNRRNILMIFQQKTDSVGRGEGTGGVHPDVLDNSHQGLMESAGKSVSSPFFSAARFNELKRVKYIPKENNATEYNIFIIYTKESQNVILKSKFELFLKSLLKYTTIPMHLHVITDEQSETSAEELIREQINHYRKVVFYTLYDVKDCAEKISDIVKNMLPLFNYKTGSYYSDALFLISLGLHRIVDVNMKRAILIDCDVVFRSSVKELFDQFDRFGPEHLFGLAPELTPVYLHILFKYRAQNPHTLFGTPYYLNKTAVIGNSLGGFFSRNAKKTKHGYPGLNSGVVMLRLDRIRQSRLYEEVIKAESVKNMVEKYAFKGHLGDQDFYTLMGFEFPGLIYRLDCVWNRQLCTWWRENGYGNVFDSYFHCEGAVKVYHGNCNTRIPE
ncbi:xyloside xylosyltransferase 1 [Malaya genurostris]|uniref:xyloside xylosyltransferase 1 n=1 Tax=Malaya genurostris TaxID=325434 RepID=UPI0026F3AD16|nr:xyloside xylosyltransferase 1 [Malaya genurostris]